MARLYFHSVSAVRFSSFLPFFLSLFVWLRTCILSGIFIHTRVQYHYHYHFHHKDLVLSDTITFTTFRSSGSIPLRDSFCQEYISILTTTVATIIPSSNPPSSNMTHNNETYMKLPADLRAYYEKRRIGLIAARPYASWGPETPEEKAKWEQWWAPIQYTFHPIDWNSGFTGRGGAFFPMRLQSR